MREAWTHRFRSGVTLARILRLSSIIAPKEKKAPRNRSALNNSGKVRLAFRNWKLLRALRLTVCLRSTTRESRVISQAL